MKHESLKMNLQSLKSRVNNEKGRLIKGKSTKTAAAFIQNKANFVNSEIGVSFFEASKYEILTAWLSKNQTQFKANSNPILETLKIGLSSFITGKYVKFEDLAVKNQSQTNPIQTQTNLSSNVVVGGPIFYQHLLSGHKFDNVMKSNSLVLGERL